jgi:hypothetical protein
MSSNKKSDKSGQEEQKAIEEAEIVAELAPDEKTRKEAEILVETVENESTSEIFDTYRQAVLNFTEHLSKFQPKYAESISNLQQEYLELTREFMNKLFAAQRNWVGSNVTSTNTTFPSWTYSPYADQFRRQSNEITAQALSVYDNSNQLALNALTAAKDNLKLYRRAMESMTEYNNNVASAWSSFLTAAQRQQYFGQ